MVSYFTLVVFFLCFYEWTVAFLRNECHCYKNSCSLATILKSNLLEENAYNGMFHDRYDFYDTCSVVCKLPTPSGTY